MRRTEMKNRDAKNRDASRKREERRERKKIERERAGQHAVQLPQVVGRVPPATNAYSRWDSNPQSPP